MNKLKPILFAIVLGCLFAFVINLKMTSEGITLAKELGVTKESKICYAFQVGVYKEYENALQISKKYESSVLVKDGEYTRVFIALATQDSKPILESYYNEKQIPYYVKEITVSASFQEKLEKFSLLIQESDKEKIDLINQEVMKSYKESANENK